MLIPGIGAASQEAVDVAAANLMDAALLERLTAALPSILPTRSSPAEQMRWRYLPTTKDGVWRATDLAIAISRDPDERDRVVPVYLTASATLRDAVSVARLLFEGTGALVRFGVHMSQPAFDLESAIFAPLFHEEDVVAFDREAGLMLREIAGVQRLAWLRVMCSAVLAADNEVYTLRLGADGRYQVVSGPDDPDDAPATPDAPGTRLN